MVLAGSAPTMVGAKVISKVQLCPGFTAAVQKLLLTVKSPAVCGAMLVMVIAEVLLFVRVTGKPLFSELQLMDVPMATVPKSKGGLGVTAIPPATTSPETVVDVLVRTLLPRSATAVTVVVNDPVFAGGVKVRPTLQEAPAAITKPAVPGAQVVVAASIAKSVEFVPDK